MLPRKTMKKQNFQGKFGKLSSSPVKKSSVPTGSKDLCTLTVEQKQHVRTRYFEVLEHNSNLSEHDDDYITQDDLKDEFNELFGVSKSIRSYYRIWNELDETDF